MKKIIMKILFIVMGIFLSQNCFSQTKEVKDTKFDSTYKQFLSTKKTKDFRKFLMQGDSLYSLTGTVIIKDGHDKNVKVLFNASVSRTEWDKFLKIEKCTDIQGLKMVAKRLALDAQYRLKNPESFKPLPSQYFMWSNSSNSFISSFKMMGRNGYGNLIETKALVNFKPIKE